jgi:hypothetical protein
MRSSANSIFIAFLVCTIVNIGLTVYYFEVLPKKSNVSASPKSLTETAALASAINNSNRQAVMRDTVILQQALKIQHQLEMHKAQKIAMCPSCSNAGSPNTEYTLTKDGPL